MNEQHRQASTAEVGDSGGAANSATNSGPWTTRRLLAWMIQAFERAELDGPRLCAEMLLSHVLGCDRLKLYMAPERPAAAAELERLRALTARALKHEPVQYLVEEAWFFSLPLYVDRRVLIPRPCTEIIAEEVVQAARRRQEWPEGPPRILDLCTGSGCIAVALAKNLPQAKIVATDISAAALEVARRNAERHGVLQQIEFRQGDLFAALNTSTAAGGDAAYAAGPFDWITANPPYISDHEWEKPGMVGANVKGQEPELALRGGPDGLALLRPIIQQAPKFLRPGGTVLIEIAASSKQAVLALAAAPRELQEAKVLDDLEGLPRVLTARIG